MPTFTIHVGKYAIHGWYGKYNLVRFHQLAIAEVPFLRFCLTVGSTHLSVKYALGSNHCCTQDGNHGRMQLQVFYRSLFTLKEKGKPSSSCWFRRGLCIRVSNLWKKTTLNVCHPPKKSLEHPWPSPPSCWGFFSPKLLEQIKGGLGWCGRAERGECALWSTAATLLLLGAWKVVAGCGTVCTGWPKETAWILQDMLEIEHMKCHGKRSSDKTD